jgi:adenylosuccinate lyase
VQVELAVLKAQVNLGLVPAGWLDSAYEIPAPTVEAWREQEAKYHHEVIGFLAAWQVYTPIHIGLTSSDLVDTAQGLAWLEYLDIIRPRALEILNRQGSIVSDRGDRWMLARTHGQPATITEAGQIWANIFGQVQQAMTDIDLATLELCHARIAGPTGTHDLPVVSKDVQRMVAESLDLYPGRSLNQVAQRVSLAAWAAAAARLVTAIEAVATLIWQYEQFGVNEIYEADMSQQSSSSAMPHKRNPIMAERLMGLGRMARSMVEPLHSGMVHFYQRDLSHSSVEREFVPALAGIVDYALVAYNNLLSAVRFDDAQIAYNLTAAGADVHSWRRLTEAQLNGNSYFRARVISEAR